MPYEIDIENLLNAQIDKQVTRATSSVSDIGEPTDDENDSLADDIGAVLLLLMAARGIKAYNNGVAMALASLLDISKTTKFVAAMTDADVIYIKDIAKSFNADTAANLNKLIANATNSGATADEIRQQLNGFKNDQAFRVNRFAQNEAWRVSEIAGLRAMIQLDGELSIDQVVGTYKTWNIQPGACPICLDYAGISVKVKDTFYGGISAPPAHVTCRCSLSYSIIKQEPSNKFEMHCASCDRFLGITEKNVVSDILKCSNTKCKSLARPVVKPPESASI